MIHFLLDVDGTMAERNTSVLMTLCNKKLKLGIDETRLQTLPYDEFLTQPEVIRYRQRMGERNFERALTWLELDPHHLIHMQPLKHALAGASCFAKIGSLLYYSTRKTSYSTHLNIQMAQATRAWLALHHFPCPERVLFFDGPQDKLGQITQLTSRSTYHLVIIDANYEQVLVSLSTLSHFMLRRIQAGLTLYAFGVTEATSSEGIEVIALPSWEHIEACIQGWIEMMEQKFAGASVLPKRWR